MRKLFIPTLVVALTACGTGKSERDLNFEAAEQCANIVLKESKAQEAKGISGQYTLTSVPRTIPIRDGAFISTEVQSVPYATSTYLDRGDEGSTWRGCMDKILKKKS